ncbi:MAG: methyltransferase [Hyphomicrobiales bacterium]
MAQTVSSFDRHYVLGGKVVLHQQTGGAHKAGLDAVMLAASVQGSRNSHNGNSHNDNSPKRIVDLGAGVGTAGLCAINRLSNATAILVENDPITLELTKATLADPDNQWLKDRASVLNADVTLRGDERLAAGLNLNMADHVIMNPPYYDANNVRISDNASRQAAHVLDERGLEPWFRTASAILVSGGMLSVIFPTAGLSNLLTLMEGRFGGISVFPLYKGEGEEANRVILCGQKGSRAPMRLLSGLVLHQAQKDGISRREWTDEANAVLNGETGLVI